MCAHMTYFKFRINMNLKGVACNAVISLILGGGRGQLLKSKVLETL